MFSKTFMIKEIFKNWSNLHSIPSKINNFLLNH